jgi:hypothetical protein
MIPPASYFHEVIASAKEKTVRPFVGGIYEVRIDSAYLFTNRQRKPYAAVVCTVLRSNNTYLPATSRASWVISLRADSAATDLKKFVTCMLPTAGDITSLDVGRIFPEKTTGATSAAVGSTTIVVARNIPTHSGGEYTKLEWQPLPKKTTRRKNVKTS